uniref:Uncharacterized protein n=1 Tax=Anguilla anguilla TaxID=7936 RepID=A0A0E9SZH0_ANGAN
MENLIIMSIQVREVILQNTS